MTVDARLGRNGSDVQCGRCHIKLGELTDGPLERVVMERGTPILGVRVVAAGEATVTLVAGYLPNDVLGGVWVQTAHAQARTIKAKRAGGVLEPKFGHGDALNGIVEYPARVVCRRCGDVCLIESVERLRQTAPA